MAAARRPEEIKNYVKERYGRIARESASSCGPSCCDTGTSSAAPALYSPDELKQVPSEAAEVSLGCGNPTAIAGLKEGEVVLDLGSGGGIDCFLAAQKVGAKGRVIGLDMTPDMIKLARANAARAGIANVEFRLGEMEKMPVDDASVDVIISNCVVNLSPDKGAVLREVFRVLKPGGRISISDMVLMGKLPARVARGLEEWAGCVAGAISVDEYRGKLVAAGFTEIALDRRGMAYPDYESVKEQLATLDITEGGYKLLQGAVASMDISARKPTS